MSEQNKALIRELFSRADKADVSVLDDVAAVDLVDHNPPPFAPPGAHGLEGARDIFSEALKIFSDFSHEIAGQWAEGEYVITRVVGRGRHTGDFMGIPASGNEVQMEGISIHRIVDGKIVEHWGQVDGVGMLMQMGAIPAPA